MRLQLSGSESYIEYSYTLYPSEYLVDFSLTMQGMDNYRTDNVQLKWQIYSPQQEKGRQNEKNYTNLNYRFYQGDVEKFSLRTKKISRNN